MTSAAPQDCGGQQILTARVLTGDDGVVAPDGQHGRAAVGIDANGGHRWIVRPQQRAVVDAGGVDVVGRGAVGPASHRVEAPQVVDANYGRFGGTVAEHHKLLARGCRGEVAVRVTAHLGRRNQLPVINQHYDPSNVAGLQTMQARSGVH